MQGSGLNYLSGHREFSWCSRWPVRACHYFSFTEGVHRRTMGQSESCSNGTLVPNFDWSEIITMELNWIMYLHAFMLVWCSHGLPESVKLRTWYIAVTWHKIDDVHWLNCKLGFLMGMPCPAHVHVFPAPNTPTSTPEGLLVNWLVESCVSEQEKHLNMTAEDTPGPSI